MALAHAGISVALNYNVSDSSAEDVKNAIEVFGGRVIIVKADVCDEDSVKNMVKNAVAHFGCLDILINCAGIMPTDPIEAMSFDSWKKVLDTNLTSCFLTIREAIPYLKNSACPRIINIGSQAAFTGSSHHSHYSASKAGILGLTYSLAKELGPLGITVNVVSPGRVDTELLAYCSLERKQEWLASTPLNRLGTDSEIANAVVFLASESASYITGANLNVNGGMLMG
jgi:NAD(P)-dependent dehydrogenase (short-subunit alcohol dehydrogenase family)